MYLDGIACLESSVLVVFTCFFSSAGFGLTSAGLVDLITLDSAGLTDFTSNGFTILDSSGLLAGAVLVALGLLSFFGACWETSSKRSGPFRSLSLNVLTSWTPIFRASVSLITLNLSEGPPSVARAWKACPIGSSTSFVSRGLNPWDLPGATFWTTGFESFLTVALAAPGLGIPDTGLEGVVF